MQLEAGSRLTASDVDFGNERRLMIGQSVICLYLH